MPRRQIFAETFSTLAIVMVSTNLVLATRARPVEHYLQGLDKVFVTHRTIGISVAFVVTTHFLIVPKSAGWVWSKPFGYTTLSLLLVAVFMASAPRFPWRRLVPLKYQTWKATHRFMGVLLAIAVTHSLFAHTYVRRVPVLTVYVYAIAAIGLAAYLYRETLFYSVRRPYSATIERSTKVASDVTEISLATASPISRVPGQFAFISMSEGPSREWHPFTISSAPPRDVRFSIKASGDFTEAIALEPPTESSRALIDGPYGRFSYLRGKAHQLWLAGGIGITPFLSMAATIDDAVRVLLVWSVHDADEAVYVHELQQHAAEHGNIEFVLHPTSERGHLEVSALELWTEPAEFSAFICSPLAMRKALIGQLMSVGVTRREIYFEEFRLR